MRILTEEEMMEVAGGRGGGERAGNSSSGRRSGARSSGGPQSRGGRRNAGRNAAMDSYLGRDVYGARAVGLNVDVAWGAGIGALSGALGGLKGMGWGGIVGAIGGLRGGLTSPSPSNRGGAMRRGGDGDSGGRGSR